MCVTCATVSENEWVSTPNTIFLIGMKFCALVETSRDQCWLGKWLNYFHNNERHWTILVFLLKTKENYSLLVELKWWLQFFVFSFNFLTIFGKMFFVNSLKWTNEKYEIKYCTDICSGLISIPDFYGFYFSFFFRWIQPWCISS